LTFVLFFIFSFEKLDVLCELFDLLLFV